MTMNIRLDEISLMIYYDYKKEEDSHGKNVLESLQKTFTDSCVSTQLIC